MARQRRCGLGEHSADARPPALLAGWRCVCACDGAVRRERAHRRPWSTEAKAGDELRSVAAPRTKRTGEIIAGRDGHVAHLVAHQRAQAALGALLAGGRRRVTTKS